MTVLAALLSCSGLLSAAHANEGVHWGYEGEIAPATRLKITFADGHVIQEPQAAETFRKFVMEVGAERIRTLGMKQNKVPLISNTLDKKYIYLFELLILMNGCFSTLLILLFYELRMILFVQKLNI